MLFLHTVCFYAYNLWYCDTANIYFHLQKLISSVMSITITWIRWNCIIITVLHMRNWDTNKSYKQPEGWNRQIMLKCLTTEVFTKPPVSILTSPMHPKYSRLIHWNTEEPVKCLDKSSAQHHTRTLWQRHAAIQFSGREFSCVSMQLYFLLQSPIHPLHIFQLPQ